MDLSGVLSRLEELENPGDYVCSFVIYLIRIGIVGNVLTKSELYRYGTAAIGVVQYR